MIPIEPGRVALNEWIAKQDTDQKKDEIIQICTRIFEATGETKLFAIPGTDFDQITKQTTEGLSAKTLRLFDALSAINRVTGPIAYHVNAIKEPDGCLKNKYYLQGRWDVRNAQEDELGVVGLAALICGSVLVFIACCGFATGCAGHYELNSDDIEEEPKP